MIRSMFPGPDNSVMLRTGSSLLGTGPDCSYFGSILDLHEIFFKISASEKIEGLQNARELAYSADIHADYPQSHAFDSLVQNDLWLFPPICDSLSVECWPYIDFNFSDYYLDKDSVFHVSGFIFGKGYDNDIHPYRLLYCTFSGTHTNFDSLTVYVPEKITSYTSIDSFNHRLAITELTGGAMLPTADSQSFSYNFVDNEIHKIDSSLHVTYNYKICGLWNSDSTQTYGTLKADTINSEIFLSGYVERRHTDIFFADSSAYLLLKFNSLGIFQSEKRFDDADMLDHAVYAMKHHFIYYPYGTDSTVIKYLNPQGDTIRSVYIAKSFHHDIVQIRKGYVHIDLTAQDPYDYIDIIVTLFDSSGRYLKQRTFSPRTLQNRDLIYSFTYRPGYFVCADTFENIFLFINYNYELAGNCTAMHFQGFVFNIENINAISGTVTDSFGAISNMNVELLLNGHSYFTTTDDSGRYEFTPFDTGRGLIILHPDSDPQYVNTGNDTIPVIISDTVANPIVNYLLLARITSVFNHSKIKTTLYPNPFNTFTTLFFDYDKPTTLSLISVEGKILQTYSSSQKNYLIYKKEMATGIYLYELRDRNTNELLSNGKIIIE